MISPIFFGRAPSPCDNKIASLFTIFICPVKYSRNLVVFYVALTHKYVKSTFAMPPYLVIKAWSVALFHLGDKNVYLLSSMD